MWVSGRFCRFAVFVFAPAGGGLLDCCTNTHARACPPNIHICIAFLLCLTDKQIRNFRVLPRSVPEKKRAKLRIIIHTFGAEGAAVAAQRVSRVYGRACITATAHKHTCTSRKLSSYCAHARVSRVYTHVLCASIQIQCATR